MYFGLSVFKVAKLKESTVAREFATSPCSALPHLKMSTVSRFRGRVRTKRCLYISPCMGGNPLRRTKYLFSFAFSWSVQLDVSTTFAVCLSELYLLKPTLCGEWAEMWTQRIQRDYCSFTERLTLLICLLGRINVFIMIYLYCQHCEFPVKVLLLMSFISNRWSF